jgi:hypothetical protein
MTSCIEVLQTSLPIEKHRGAAIVAAAGFDPMPAALMILLPFLSGSSSMPPKKNPLNLNPLQLRTLTLLQALSRLPGHARPFEESGEVMVGALPQPHGDHFHLGSALVMTRDATGLANEAAWVALERKGLIRSMFPDAAVLTVQGLAYETGLADTILHHADH